MIPDFIPMLRKFAGPTPQHGGCLVQVASFLYDGHSWTDRPACVYPLLGSVGIHVNDYVNDKQRHVLALMAPRLSGSAYIDSGIDTEFVNFALAFWAARQSSDPEISKLVADTAADGGRCAEDCEDPRCIASLVELCRYAIVSTEFPVHTYRGFVDEFDRLTGRTSTSVIPRERWDSVTAAMAG